MFEFTLEYYSSYLHVNKSQISIFKTIDTTITYLLCFKRASKDITKHEMKEIALLKENALEFSFNNKPIGIKHMLTIHEYSMKKHNEKLCLDFFKSVFGVSLNVGGSLTPSDKKHIYLNNQPCLATPYLIDRNRDKPHFYPFVVSLDRCSRSCDIIQIYIYCEDLFSMPSI